MKNKQRGDHIAAVLVGITVILIGIVGFVGYNAFQKQNADAGGTVDGRKNPPVQLTVGTYNVLGFNHNTSASKYTNRERMQNAAKVIKEHDADIFVANEINDPSQRDVLLQNLNNWQATFRKTGNQDALVFWNKSEYTMEDSGETIVPVIPKSPYRPQPWVKLRHNKTDKKLYVFGVHMPRLVHGNNQNIAARKIVDKIRDVQKKDPDAAVILAGDMNTNDSRGHAYDKFKDSGLLKDSRFSTDNRTGNRCDTHHELGKQQCKPKKGSHIDQIWVSKKPNVMVNAFEVVVNEQTAHVSDHNPVIVKLLF